MVVDLVRYLVEFTRDYYQQMVVWRWREEGGAGGERKGMARSSSVKEAADVGIRKGKGRENTDK